MRLLVVSDSHGRTATLRDIIMIHSEADGVIFLGDGESDINKMMGEFPERNFFCVKGNCDYYSQNPDMLLEVFRGKRVYITHGYREQVKFGEGLLLEKAASLSADIILYGHTHNPVTRYEKGKYIMNPGSVSAGCYGLIDIVPGGIMLNNCTL